MRWIIFIAVLLIIEFYSWQAVSTASENKWLRRIYLILSLLGMIFIIYSFSQMSLRAGLDKRTMIGIGVFLTIYVPKLLITFLILTEDVFRLIFGGIQSLTGNSTGEGFMPDRRKFISQSVLALASVPFLSLIYGMVKGRYQFRVIKQQVFFDDLPEEFDGFKILQLSDIHCGSFDNHEKIQYGIDMINEQDYDLMVFTGDLVNNYASEMDEWLPFFKQLKTPEFGKFSILGNHDYGQYAKWDSKREEEENLKAVKDLHPKLGFDLLLNENRKIKKGNAEISLVGVENWGKGNFQKFGDLEKASEGIEEKDFKILLSHDPSHWDMKVQDNPIKYHLTLSGHTHGMQFGIEIPGLKWSLIKYRYPHWAGLYENKNRFLYVNRGFGYLAYPGRVGIWPEITVLELKKS